MIKKIYYFTGGPRHRVLMKLIQEKFHIDSVIIPHKENIKLKETLEICEKHTIPIVKINKSDLSYMGKNYSDGLVLSVGFSYIFPKEFLNVIPLALNVHGTLLPKYPGARTLNWVLVNNDPFSGVTVHKIAPALDQGDILLQRSFPVSLFDSAKSIYRKTLEFEPDIVVQALQHLQNNKGFFQPQDLSNMMAYPNRDPEDGLIDMHKSILDNYHLIRACDDEKYPAHFYMNGEKVCIKLWRPSKSDDEKDFI